MTELAKRYKAFSGLMFIDVDKLLEKTQPKDLPSLFNKLMWNIQRGSRFAIGSKPFNEFAWIICELATACNLDINAEDIIPDGIIDYYDKRTHLELFMAHEVLDECEHSEELNKDYLSKEEESEEEKGLILEEGDGKIEIEK